MDYRRERIEKEGNDDGFVIIPMFQEVLCSSFSSSVPRLSLFVGKVD